MPDWETNFCPKICVLGLWNYHRELIDRLKRPRPECHRGGFVWWSIDTAFAVRCPAREGLRDGGAEKAGEMNGMKKRDRTRNGVYGMQCLVSG